VSFSALPKRSDSPLPARTGFPENQYHPFGARGVGDSLSANSVEHVERGNVHYYSLI